MQGCLRKKIHIYPEMRKLKKKPTTFEANVLETTGTPGIHKKPLVQCMLSIAFFAR
jgi:hypothetical protein